MDYTKWLLFIYKVPVEPSTVRVNTLEEDKGAGAVPLQQSIYVLSDTEKLKPELDSLKRQINGHGCEGELGWPTKNTFKLHI
ncbi:hypothetical protein [Calorimonas adulescens]|uniref:Uncharacterized protein n=1 Tax=Calorimonas adulescens TaxID=2606906 RepID=A0A5D8Q8B4_9THEO|nr:hypothetical protein [Calorimonas adulescens]TZE80741.1 hypothetical protein FWJ32_12355 [Calorimonas adulescens]